MEDAAAPRLPATMVSMMAKTDSTHQEVPKVTTKKRAPPLVATSSSSRPTAANKKPRSLAAPLLIAGPPQQAAPPRSSRRWPESLEALKKFKREHGHANVPHGYDQDTALSSWVKKQRKCRESLTEAKRKALDAVGFIWEPNSKKWNDNSFRTIQELRQQLYDNGTLKIGMKLTCDAFSNHIGHKTKIANWFRHQVLTKDTELTPQQRLQLDTLLNELATGVPPNHQQQTPTTIINKKSPNKKPPNKKSPNHKGNNKKRKPNKSSLASNKKKKTATVVVPQQKQSPSATTTTTARRKPLQQPLQQNPQDMDHQDMALLVDDHHNNDHLWYTKLAQVIQLGNGLDISNLDPIDYSQRINDEATATWFRHQIRLLRRGRLNNGGSVLKARQSKLMAFLKQFRNGHDYAIIPPAQQQQQQEETTSKYSRNAAPSRWLDRFDALKQFKQAFGHTIVPHPYPADMTLGQWVRTQRRTRPSMLPARRQALDDIGFVWEPKNKKWNDRFDGCRNKKRVWYEHARRRPKGTIEEFADYLGSSTTLGRWFLSQLEQLRKGSLNEDQETRFELFLSNLSSYSPAEEAPQQTQQQPPPMISAAATALGTEESGAFLPEEEGSDEEGDVFDDAEEEQDTMGESLQEQQQDKKQQQQQEEKKEETESWIVPAKYMPMTTTTTGPANQYYNTYYNVVDTSTTLGPAVPVQADNNNNNPTQYMPMTTSTSPANHYYNAYHNVPDTNTTLGPEGPVPAQYIPMTTTSPANNYYNAYHKVPDTTTCTLGPAVPVQANNNPTKKEMGGDDYIFMLGLQREEDEEYETI